jgi:hypothetical protein
MTTETRTLSTYSIKQYGINFFDIHPNAIILENQTTKAEALTIAKIYRYSILGRGGREGHAQWYLFNIDYIHSIDDFVNNYDTKVAIRLETGFHKDLYCPNRNNNNKYTETFFIYNFDKIEEVDINNTIVKRVELQKEKLKIGDTFENARGYIDYSIMTENIINYEEYNQQEDECENNFMEYTEDIETI